MTCKDCNGCTDDNCSGGCGMRWCGGAYMGEGCDRCPEKVPKTIETPKGPLEIMVRCNASTDHKGIHHWNPWKAGQ